MRRKDREITEWSELVDVIQRCDVCRLVLNDGDYPYIVPLNFGFDAEDGNITLYFHSALEGYKTDLFQREIADDSMGLAVLVQTNLLVWAGIDAPHGFSFARSAYPLVEIELETVIFHINETTLAYPTDKNTRGLKTKKINGSHS